MKNIIPSLIKLADHLDSKGFLEEASLTDEIIRKIAEADAEEAPAGDEKPGDGEEKPEEEAMMPMKLDEKEEAACMGSSKVQVKNAQENLEKVQLRIRARQRRLLVK